MRLDDLQTAFDLGSPVTTVYLDVTAAEENADREVTLRWKEVEARLRQAGAPEADVEALAAVAAAPSGRGGPASRFAAARDGQVLVEEVLPQAAADGIGWGRVGPFPDVEPLLAGAWRERTFVLARVDRTGADLEAHEAVLSAPSQERTVTGDTLYARKVQGGGWAHRRFQNTAEDVWRSNARDVAEEVTALADGTGTELVVVAGEQRMVTYVRGDLPERLDVVEVVSDVRAAGADGSGVEDAVLLAVAERAALDEEDTLDRLRAAQGERGTDSAVAPQPAAFGLDDVVAALQQSQVSLLVVDPDGLAERRLVVGPAAYDLARPDAPRTWDGPAVECPALQGLVRAAALTGARVELGGGDVVTDGAAALLRW